MLLTIPVDLVRGEGSAIDQYVNVRLRGIGIQARGWRA
jgi:hypothetical protein